MSINYRCAGLTALLILDTAVLLSACGIAGMTGPYPGVPEVTSGGGYSPSRGPVSPPQVGYRIDGNRYFEIVPASAGACSNANLYYVDIAKGIWKLVEDYDRGSMIEGDFIIDAANQQYLIAPISRGNVSCSSGGGYCRGATLRYSTDEGRTWKSGEAFSAGTPLIMSGSVASAIGLATRSLDISKNPLSLKDWRIESDDFVLHIRKAPIDNRVHCVPNGKE